MAERIVIYTDGACIGNPGPGGWAAVLRRYDGEALLKQKAIAGCSVRTTTNIVMEMTAAREALGCLNDGETGAIVVVSDNKVLVDGASTWLAGWKANGWRKVDRKAAANLDLWKAIDEEIARLPPIVWQWVRAHSGDPHNEEVDRLASAEARKAAEVMKGRRRA